MSVLFQHRPNASTTYQRPAWDRGRGVWGRHDFGTEWSSLKSRAFLDWGEIGLAKVNELEAWILHMANHRSFNPQGFPRAAHPLPRTYVGSKDPFLCRTIWSHYGNAFPSADYDRAMITHCNYMALLEVLENGPHLGPNAAEAAVRAWRVHKTPSYFYDDWWPEVENLLIDEAEDNGRSIEDAVKNTPWP